MIFAQVVGTVVATRRADALPGARFLLVRQCSPAGKPAAGKRPGGRGSGGGWHVALDSVGAGPGELVMVSQGSSCRQTRSTHGQPVDALICGIVDLVDERGKLAYRK